MADADAVFDPAEPEVKTLMERKAQAQGNAERKRIGRVPKMFSPMPAADPATAILDEQDDDEPKPATTYASGGIISGGLMSFSVDPNAGPWFTFTNDPPAPPEPRRAMPSHDELQSALDALAESLGAFEVVIEGQVKSRRFKGGAYQRTGDRGELVLKIKVNF